MNAFRLISDVKPDEYGDPIAWQDKCSPLILVDATGPVTYATSNPRKRGLVERARESGTLLFAWAGRYSTDVFEVDDLDRAAEGLGQGMVEAIA